MIQRNLRKAARAKMGHAKGQPGTKSGVGKNDKTLIASVVKLFLHRPQPMLHRDHRGLGAVRDLQLAQDGADVVPHRALG